MLAAAITTSQPGASLCLNTSGPPVTRYDKWSSCQQCLFLGRRNKNGSSRQKSNSKTPKAIDIIKFSWVRVTNICKFRCTLPSVFRPSPATFQMDRSVRMLGVQPLDRLGQSAKMPSSSLLWRAVLEVIIYTTDIMLAVCVSVSESAPFLLKFPVNTSQVIGNQ